MTPFEIDILLRFYTRPASSALDGICDSTLLHDTLANFQKAKLLEYSPCYDEIRPGPALECYAEALCAVPAPVQKWVMP